jgi:hypothetical protein
MIQNLAYISCLNEIDNIFFVCFFYFTIITFLRNLIQENIFKNDVNQKLT